MLNDKGYLSPQELSKLLGISNQATYSLLKTKGIEVLQLSPRKKLIPPKSIRHVLSSRGFNYPSTFFAIHDLKGGVGKTTIALSFGVRASYFGAKVLLIDMDLQGNLTQYCSVDPTNIPVWVNLIREEATITECIINIGESLDLIPSNLNNSRLDIELASNTNVNIKHHVRDILKPIIKNYDLIIVDCPPSLCKTTTIVTCASDIILIPITPDQFSMDGMNMTVKEIKRIEKTYKIKLDYKILWNKYDARKKKLSPFFLHKLAQDKEKYDKTLPGVIRIDSAFEISQQQRKSIFELKRKTNAHEDIDTLTKELLDIEVKLQ